MSGNTEARNFNSDVESIASVDTEQITVQIKENSYNMAAMIPVTNCENIQGHSKYFGSKLTDFSIYFLPVIFPDIFQLRYSIYQFLLKVTELHIMLEGNEGKLRFK
jgi:hypothetical protein